MAASATLYRIECELSDLDRNVYQSLDLRLAQHPSEPLDRVVVRAIAFILLVEENLEFGRGLSDSDEAALWTHDLTGQLLHWVDVGLPSADRIHLASKRAERVTIVCHKDPEALRRELARRKVHRSENLTILTLDPGFVAELADSLARNNTWVALVQDGDLSITTGDVTRTTTIGRPDFFS